MPLNTAPYNQENSVFEWQTSRSKSKFDAQMPANNFSMYFPHISYNNVIDNKCNRFVLFTTIYVYVKLTSMQNEQTVVQIRLTALISNVTIA